MDYDSIFRPGLLDGQTVIVTDGGSGIGRYAAHELATPSAHMVLVGRKAERLEKTVGEIVGNGGSVGWRVYDIRGEGTVKTLVANILVGRKTVHHLVNNAGGQYPSPLAPISQKGFGTVFHTNLIGDFLVAHEVFNQSVSKTDGSVVDMLVGIWDGMPDMGRSGAAHSGMGNFTRTAAVEWGHADVWVNAVAPGWVASSGTGIYEGVFKAMIPTLREHVPFKRIGSESEAVAAIVFLPSPGAAFVNDNAIRIDGAASQGSRTFPLFKGKPGQNRAYNGFHRAYLPGVLKGQED